MTWFSMKDPNTGYEVTLKQLKHTDTPDYLECNQNPFEVFPHFKNIWENPEFQQHAEQATAEYFESSKNPNFKDGSILVIFISGNEFTEQTPIGICGWYDVDNANDYWIAHRWFGIIPSYQKRGFARLALNCMECTVFNIVEALYVTVFTEHALNFWVKMGYTLVDPNSDEYQIVKSSDDSEPKYILKTT